MLDQYLADHDLVIGPAVDGGYYLIGVHGSWSEIGNRVESLFRDVPWSTSEVFQMTKQRAAAAKLSMAELERLEDVDTIAELTNLMSQLSKPGTDSRGSELRIAIEQILNDPNLADSA